MVLLEQVAEALLHSWRACTLKRVVAGIAGPMTAVVVATLLAAAIDVIESKEVQMADSSFVPEDKTGTVHLMSCEL